MNVVLKNIEEIKPYKNNPRKNENSIKYVENSIRDFGFKVPIIIDKNGEIVAGHTRYEASKNLGLEKVPCVVADDLNEAQIKAFRIADNKVADFSKWDFDKLAEEIKALENVDFSQYGFEELKNKTKDFFEQSKEERDANKEQEEDEEYNEFLDKFKPKLTTDDCYTPSCVYDCICDYLEEEYGLDRKNFVRPFKPNGDYKHEEYKEGQIVVDNPPFSIESKIVDFYLEKGIKFFLFASGLTTMNLLAKDRKITLIICSTDIVYENGAEINTNYVTNLGDNNIRIKTAPRLDLKLKKCLKLCKDVKKVAKYEYPKNVLKILDFEKVALHDFNIKADQICYKHDLKNSNHCYGGCCLVSDEIADKFLELKENKIKVEQETGVAQTIVLSDEELEIIKRLNDKKI